MVRSSRVQLERCFPDLGLQPTRMAPDASSPPSPHLNGWKADPNLKHSDGQNICNWELVTPRQSKTQQNPRDKTCLKIHTPPYFFYPSLPRNCGPLCLVLRPSKIQLLRKVSVKARQAIPIAEPRPFLHFTVATEDALKRKLLQL